MNRTVLLVDDHSGFRSATAWLLGGIGYEVIEFDSAEALLKRGDPIYASGLPCCVLTDVRMPGMDGLRLHDALIARGLDWPVIYMTGHGDVPLAVAAMRKGACSFLEKPFRESALEEALAEAFTRTSVRRVPTGPGALHPTVGSESPAPIEVVAAQARLTPRERQVLDLVVEGCLNKIIADRLGISIKTVELHRANMMHKIGARSITELMRRVLIEARVA